MTNSATPGDSVRVVPEIAALIRATTIGQGLPPLSSPSPAAIRQLSSLHPDVGDPDYPGPLVGFVNDELPIFCGRQLEHRSAEIGEPRLHLLITDDLVDRRIELVDDFRPGCLRRAQTEHG